MEKHDMEVKEKRCDTCQNWQRVKATGKPENLCGIKHYMDGSGRFRCKGDHTCDKWIRDQRKR